MPEWLLCCININRIWKMCCVYIICCRKTLAQLQYHLNVFFFILAKTEDIPMTLQLCKCLFATNICGQNRFLMCDIISDRVKSFISKTCKFINLQTIYIYMDSRGARWLSGRVSDSGARGPGFETYRRRVVSLSKTLYSPKVLVNYPGSDGSVPTWLKNCWLGR